MAAALVGATLHRQRKVLMLKIGSQIVGATFLPSALDEEEGDCGFHDRDVSGLGLPNPTASGTGLGG